MKILLAVDDLDFGQAMCAYAVQNAQLSAAEVRIVTVIPSLLAYTSLAVIPDLVQDMRDQSRLTAISLLQQTANRIRVHCPEAIVDQCVLEGTPADEILSMARLWSADMILIGSHGKKGISRLVQGSVSQSVASRAPCSVLVIDLKHCAEHSCTADDEIKDKQDDRLAVSKTRSKIQG